MEIEKIARWAFTAFVIIAIVMGLVVGYMAWNTGLDFSLGFGQSDVENVNGWVTLVLLILGVIVGLVLIAVKEVMPFLVATVALIVASIANVWEPLTIVHPLLAYWATGILNYIVAFAAPAAVINGIKAVMAMAKEK
jgi:uncharacterized membrane protein